MECAAGGADTILEADDLAGRDVGLHLDHELAFLGSCREPVRDDPAALQRFGDDEVGSRVEVFREGSDLDLDRSFLRQRRECGAEAFLGEQRGEEPVTDLA